MNYAILKKLAQQLSIFPIAERDTALLSASVDVDERTDLSSLQGAGALISAVVVIFLVWAGFANIRAVSQTSGEVAPSGSIRIVQHLYGGSVKEIHVDDGQLVQAGEALIILDGGGLHEDMRIAIDRQAVLEARAERFRAFIDGRAPVFSATDTSTNLFIKSQTDTFNSMAAAIANERSVIESQRHQRKQALSATREELKTISKNRALVEDLYRKRKALAAEGYLSSRDLLDAEREMNALIGDETRLRQQIAQAKTAIDEYDQRLALQKTQARDEAYVSLDTLSAEIAQNQEVIDKLNARISNLAVTSPVNGLIKELSVRSVGAVIAPGQVIAEVVPVEEELLVEIRIAPGDIGQIRVGHDVNVKFSAYDFSQFGSLRGRLEYISATTFKGQNGERYYRGRVRLEKNYLGARPGENPVMPGMTVKADIILGDRTLLAYLLSPLRNTTHGAFKEQ